jgi:hypothetical protein
VKISSAMGLVGRAGGRAGLGMAAKVGAASALVLLAQTAATSTAAGGALGEAREIAAQGADKEAIARAFVALVNDVNEESVKKFESEYRSPKNKVALAERVKRLESMQKDFGKLTIEETIPGGASSLTMVCKDTKGRNVVLEFMFDEASGGKMEGAMVSVGGDEVRPKSVDGTERAKIVEDACSALEKGYVFPELGKKMAEHVRGKMKAGAYDAMTSDGALARALTADFRSISKDGHLHVAVQPKQDRVKTQGEESNDFAGTEEMMRKDNYAFRKVELLEGNIGYIRFDLFIDHPGARKAADAAIALVKNADAIIFDMRYNGGGTPKFIQYITSYLFDEKTHLNDMVDRDGKIVEEYWTLPEIASDAKVASTPVYVLTSSHSFSGAEEFTYNLKNLKRATIVGETTGGGAHPVRGQRLNDRVVIGIPFMRAQNPITKTNWEGTGVEPDVKVSSLEALEKALELARSKRASR